LQYAHNGAISELRTQPCSPSPRRTSRQEP
jgi:hypothetical protein